MLPDRVVCGVNEETIQCHLLAESGLTLEKALEVAKGLEAAARNVREIEIVDMSDNIVASPVDISRQKKSMK